MIKIGNVDVDKIYVGPNKISKAAVGSEIIWDSDKWVYDLIDENNYNEIDILYTTDVHGGWLGYDSYYYGTSIFNYDDVSNYRTKLQNNGAKVLLVDGGDWSHGSESINDSMGKDASDQMNAKGYFAVTYGNHEWKWGGSSTTRTILDRCNNMVACNFLKNGVPVYKPYKTAKIGDKRIAIIGVGYPSPNGNGSYSGGVWSYEGYQFYDGQKLFDTVQGYIDMFKANDFDHIIVVSHMCKSTYEDDSRYVARTDTLIQNTSGLTAVLQGHFNQQTQAELITDKGGNTVLLAHEAGAVMNCFGRLKLTKSGIVESSLITSREEL